MTKIHNESLLQVAKNRYAILLKYLPNPEQTVKIWKSVFWEYEQKCGVEIKTNFKV